MEFLKSIQPDIMLALSAICGVLALLACLTNTMSKKRKLALVMMEISAMLLMIFDRRAYIYRGNTSSLGWWMVRVCNFAVFFLTLVVIYGFNLYLIDLFTHEGGLDRAPRRLKAAGIVALAGMAVLVVAHFTGLYYTFDEMNRYQRAPGFMVSYIFPLAALILQLLVIVQYCRRLKRGIAVPLLLFTGLCIITPVIQSFLYGISLNNIVIALISVLLYIFALVDMAREVEQARQQEIDYYKEQQRNEHALFEQTAEALASAIDAKDAYTHGHSLRVAMYSAEIARKAGKSEEECDKIYFAALLHDVGKIGIPDVIINKNGKLTDEEFAEIKMHPVYGNQILSTIHRLPYLSIGADAHHERFDGRGYPHGLKGDDIPDIARIIAVADAYDAMTSKRSYRDPIPQQRVREEILKGMGAQFDPRYAKIMLNMIDRDIEYAMREHEEESDDAFITRIKCEEIYRDSSTGIPIMDCMVRIQCYSRPDDGFPEAESIPTIVLFDALDGRVHLEEDKRKELMYFEYARLRFDGQTVCEGARKLETRITRCENPTEKPAKSRVTSYAVEAVRMEDHVLIRISDGEKTAETIIALPDSARFSYISITGEHCMIRNIHVDREDFPIDKDAIPRIAEEISYIRGCPEGDVPNVQVNRWRSSSTEGMKLTGNMKLTFHGRSLPTARLVWHCPYISLYTSKDGKVNGEGYREFLLLRLDGESWDSDTHARNEARIEHTHAFPGWNVWKDANRQGIDWEVLIRRDANSVEMETETLGILIINKTTIMDEVDDLYVALTGDQVALTDIHAAPAAGTT